MREDCIVEEHGMKTIPLFAIEACFVMPDVHAYQSVKVHNCMIDGLLAEADDRDNCHRVANISGKGIHVDAIVHEGNSRSIKFEAWKEDEKRDEILFSRKRLQAVAEDVADETKGKNLSFI